jgi:23S rRNA-/tRNA-specific pseudouridylate synthase
MPLYGDGRYGGGGGNLALFAHTLEFCHPVSGKKMIFSDKPDMTAEPWNIF